jgi:hypothetical protein
VDPVEPVVDPVEPLVLVVRPGDAHHCVIESAADPQSAHDEQANDVPSAAR